MKDLRVVVEEVLGFCDIPMKPGDSFEVRSGVLEFGAGGRFCMWALSSLIPFLPAKQRCGDDPNDWMPRTCRLACPDPNGRVIFRVEVIESDRPGIQPQATVRMGVKASLCTGCRSCELVCAASHGDTHLPERSRIRIVSDDRTCTDTPQVCRQCGVAACVRACPEGALSRDAGSGAVLVQVERCTGCGLCVSACPFHAMRLAPDSQVAMTCDLCGGDPNCLGRCPSGALYAIALKG
jgi:anaerobic carbon-monoxide dehydrogenase iron sulfur subunit